MLESRAQPSACLHCGRAVKDGSSFCCQGCEGVHTLLVRRGLSHFYEMRGPNTLAPVIALPVITLADNSFPPGIRQARYYIEGIHCLGCLWLLEKLPEIDGRIESASLDYVHGILTVERSEEITWHEVSQTIRELGYNPKPLSEDEGELDRRRDLRAQATRLGVAAFSAGNIMLLTVSLYAGAEGPLAQNFQWLSLLLSLPALTYSAFPLYRAAWGPLRRGRASVDLAVSLALVTGFGLSAFNVVRGSRDTYFDSLTMLVFLLLTSRFFLNRFRESVAKETACLSFLSGDQYVRLYPDAGPVTAEEIRAADEIVLYAGQTVPTDARLDGAEAHFDYSLLTGESAPVKLLRGDLVEAGARLLAASARLTVARVAEESRLAKILGQIRSFRLTRSPSLEFADRVGQRFVFAVLALAASLTLLLPFPEGLHRALVLVIVTCPCVLAFAVPLAFTRTLQQAARAGILFRATDKIEALAHAKTAFLDKTGTLTEGNFEVLEWAQSQGDAESSRSAVLALEKHSAHPVAKALVRFLDVPATAPAALAEFREIPGHGVTGKIKGHLWEVARLEGATSPHNRVGVYRDGQLQATISLGDRVRPEAAEFIRQLRAEGVEPYILSGDSEIRVASVAKTLGISYWRSRLSPEEKAAAARAERGAVMIGDGANDAVAFQAAEVGIAVRGAMDLSLQNADVALASPGLDGALRAVRAAKRAMGIVRANFAISLAYNVAAGALAVSGAMSPLLAATLMPLSALSVFAFTQIRTKEKLS